MLCNDDGLISNDDNPNYDFEDLRNIEEMENILRKKLEYNEFKRTIESVLFQARRPVKLREFLKIFPKINRKKIINAIFDIQKEYELFNTVLKIIEYSNDRFELIVKKEIVNTVGKFTLGDLFNESEIKTLAYITYKQPKVLKRDIAYKFGCSAYNTIKNLKKKGFIEEINKKIFLTTFFSEYFELKDNSPINLKAFM